MTPTRDVRALLQSELGARDPDAFEFAIEACQTYVEGRLPENRNRHKIRGKRLARIVRQLKRLSIELGRIEAAIHVLSDDLRQLHTPESTPVTCKILPRLASARYSQDRPVADPGAPIDRFAQVLTETHKFLSSEIAFLEGEALNTKPVWKSKPYLWWQKGTFEYLLDRLFRSRFDLTVQEADKLIIKIRLKLDHKLLKFDEDARCCRYIRDRIRKLSPALKDQCDDILSDTLESPLPPRR